MNCICKEKGCNGLCDYAIGGRILRLLTEANTIQTSVGDSEVDTYSNSKLEVVGHQIYKGESSSKIMKYTQGLMLLTEKKLPGTDGVNPYKALEGFVTRNKLDPGTLNYLKDFEKRRLIIMPFKPGQVCKIRVHTTDFRGVTKESEVKTEIDSIKCSIHEVEGKESTYEPMTQVITEWTDSKNKTRASANLEEYGKRFYIPDLEMGVTKEVKDLGLIKLSKYGYVHPIEVSKGNLVLIVDNCNVYMKSKSNNSIATIGEWQDSKLVLDSKVDTWMGIGPLISLLEKCQNYIGRYRKYIAPYRTTSCNYIEL